MAGRPDPAAANLVLLLYTDGLIEGRIGIGGGAPRLPESASPRRRAALRRPRARACPQEIVRAVETLNGGPLLDDTAAVLVAGELAMPEAVPGEAASLRRRLAISITVAAGCLLLGVIVLIIALTRAAGATSAQVDRLDPAEAAALDLSIALLDQQIAIRGYALTADAALLAPYDDGVTAQADAIDRLSALLG